MNVDDRQRERDAEPHPDRLWTVPNLLCAIRLAGTPALVALAWFERSTWFIALFVFLYATDLIDGRIARWLRQFSSFGARLDSVADFALFAALLIGSVLLVPEYVFGDWPLIAAPIAMYSVSCLASLVKFRRLPSYHTRLAKLSTYLVVIGAILVIAGVTVWGLRGALVILTITNIEAIAITLVIPEWRTDVISLRKALRIARSAESQS